VTWSFVEHTTLIALLLFALWLIIRKFKIICKSGVKVSVRFRFRWFRYVLRTTQPIATSLLNPRVIFNVLAGIKASIQNAVGAKSLLKKDFWRALPEIVNKLPKVVKKYKLWITAGIVAVVLISSSLYLSLFVPRNYLAFPVRDWKITVLEHTQPIMFNWTLLAFIFIGEGLSEVIRKQIMKRQGITVEQEIKRWRKVVNLFGRFVFIFIIGLIRGIYLPTVYPTEKAVIPNTAGIWIRTGFLRRQTVDVLLGSLILNPIIFLIKGIYRGLFEQKFWQKESWIEVFKEQTEGFWGKNKPLVSSLHHKWFIPCWDGTLVWIWVIWWPIMGILLNSPISPIIITIIVATISPFWVIFVMFKSGRARVGRNLKLCTHKCGRFLA